MIKVRNFLLSDIPSAADMAYSIWSDEIEDLEETEKRLIYEFLVRHSLYDLDYSFAAERDGKLLSFLLADGKHNSNPEPFNEVSYGSNLSKTLNFYRKYLDYNKERCLKYLDDETVYLALFSSREKGCGSLLIDALEKKCRAEGKKRLCLWSDTTCNYSYYEKNRYEMVETFEGKPLSDGLIPQTFIYIKSL
jgi:hypothetical protein